MKQNYQTNKQHAARKKHRKTKRIIVHTAFFVLGVCVGLLIGIIQKKLSKSYDSYAETTTNERLKALCSAEIPSWIDCQIIPIDDNSRNGTALGGVNDIVIHYIGNPGTTAQQNHDFYCNPESDVSSHFIVGLDGEIIQCIPLGEMSAASNWRNRDTISIEVCHPDESGKFTQATYESLVRLTAWLTKASLLDESHIIRHHDITGKGCPLYYVEHEDAWETFINDVRNY